MMNKISHFQFNERTYYRAYYIDGEARHRDADDGMMLCDIFYYDMIFIFVMHFVVRWLLLLVWHTLSFDYRFKVLCKSIKHLNMLFVWYSNLKCKFGHSIWIVRLNFIVRFFFCCCYLACLCFRIHIEICTSYLFICLPIFIWLTLMNILESCWRAIKWCSSAGDCIVEGGSFYEILNCSL